MKDSSLFAFDEPEKNEMVKKLEAENKKYTLQRSKGLGENEPDMMWETTMNPATRRLIRVTRADAEKTAYIFETLLGAREFIDELAQELQSLIAAHGAEYMTEVDAY